MKILKISVMITCSMFVLLAGCANDSTTVSLIEKEPQGTEAALSQEKIIAGSGSNLAITHQLLKAYESKSGIHIELPKSIGSGGAIKAVKAGALTIGLISRPLKEEEKKEGLKQLPYAQLGVVLGVNSKVPDANITLQELVDIYAGKKTTWNKGDMIIVLNREEGDSSNLVLEKKIAGFKEVLKESLQQKRWEVLFTDQEAADAIANTANSIGLSDTGTIKISHPNIKPLNIDGVAPTTENIAKGTYKLVKNLYFVYKDENLIKWEQDFLNFVYSDEGTKVITQSGAIPLEKVSE